MYSELELSCICTAAIIQRDEILLSHQKISNLQFPIELQIVILKIHLRKHFAHRKINTDQSLELVTDFSSAGFESGKFLPSQWKYKL